MSATPNCWRKMVGAGPRTMCSAASPPDRPKVRQEQIDAETAGQRLDNFLLGTLKGVPRSHVYRLIRSGQVRVNSGRVNPKHRLKAGDLVRVPPVASKPVTSPAPRISSCSQPAAAHHRP